MKGEAELLIASGEMNRQSSIPQLFLGVAQQLSTQWSVITSYNLCSLSHGGNLRWRVGLPAPVFEVAG